MSLQKPDKFEIVDSGQVVETIERQPYGGKHTMLVHHFERTVRVRRTLVCEACGEPFSYTVLARLQWVKSYRRHTLELDALEQLYVGERRRTTDPNADDPVVCPHCYKVQGAQNGTGSPVTKALDWLRRTLSL